MRERQAREAAGYINLWSAYAGIVLVNGGETQFTVQAEKTAQVRIENANGEYTIAVRDSGGTVYQANATVTIRRTGPDNSYEIVVLNPNPGPNSPDDFGIRQNAQGGITITSYKGTRIQVVIPETIDGVKITEIGGGVFRRKSLISVVIPNTVTVIGESAFYGLNLTSITIPNSVTTIGPAAFMNGKLTSVTIPDSVTAIGTAAFRNNNLTSLVLGNRLTEIGINTFRGNSLTTISLPATLRVVGDRAFFNNKIESLTVAHGVTYLGEGSFSNNPLTTVVIPASLAGYNGYVGRYSMDYGDYGPEEGSESRNAESSYGAGFAGAFARYYEEYGNPDIWYPSGEPNRTITTITLPANVSAANLGESDGYRNNFNEDFQNFYISQNRRAGTYTWTGRIWVVQ